MDSDNKTKQNATKTAQMFINRLNTGYYKTFNDMYHDINHNFIDNKYIHLSNDYITYLWNYIHAVTNN